MTNQSNIPSVVSGRFCEVVNFFRNREVDAVDQLVQRALTVIFATDNYVRSAGALNPDRFSAHMFASLALETIHRSKREYPFVRDNDMPAVLDKDTAFKSAEDLIARAEALLQQGTGLTPLSEHVRNTVDAALRFYDASFGKPYINAYYGPAGIVPVFATGAGREAEDYFGRGVMEGFMSRGPHGGTSYRSLHAVPDSAYPNAFFQASPKEFGDEPSLSHGSGLRDGDLMQPLDLAAEESLAAKERADYPWLIGEAVFKTPKS